MPDKITNPIKAELESFDTIDRLLPADINRDAYLQWCHSMMIPTQNTCDIDVVELFRAIHYRQTENQQFYEMNPEHRIETAPIRPNAFHEWITANQNRIQTVPYDPDNFTPNGLEEPQYETYQTVEHGMVINHPVRVVGGAERAARGNGDLADPRTIVNHNLEFAPNVTQIADEQIYRPAYNDPTMVNINHNVGYFDTSIEMTKREIALHKTYDKLTDINKILNHDYNGGMFGFSIRNGKPGICPYEDGTVFCEMNLNTTTNVKEYLLNEKKHLEQELTYLAKLVDKEQIIAVVGGNHDR